MVVVDPVDDGVAATFTSRNVFGPPAVERVRRGNRDGERGAGLGPGSLLRCLALFDAFHEVRDLGASRVGRLGAFPSETTKPPRLQGFR